LGNTAEAIASLRRSLEINPQNSSAAATLKELEKKTSATCTAWGGPKPWPKPSGWERLVFLKLEGRADYPAA
jgi:hypothetical protein